MKRSDKLDKQDLVFINQPWCSEEKKLFSNFLKWRNSNNDFWNALSPEQQLEIIDATEEIERGVITDYETFIARHRS